MPTKEATESIPVHVSPAVKVWLGNQVTDRLSRSAVAGLLLEACMHRGERVTPPQVVTS